eukprot:9413942-Ditylum_brightwellii.AAC.1
MDDEFKNWMLEFSYGFEQKNDWALERRLVCSMDGVSPRKLDEVSMELADTKRIFRNDTKSAPTSMQYNQ